MGGGGGRRLGGGGPAIVWCRVRDIGERSGGRAGTTGSCGERRERRGLSGAGVVASYSFMEIL